MNSLYSYTMKLTPKEREMLRRAAELILAGEWPWEPEKAVERKALERAIEKLLDKRKP